MILLRFGVLFIVCSIILPACLVQAVQTAGSLTEDELHIFDEAVENIRLHALSPPHSMRDTVGGMLRTYVQTFDRYADFLTSREYAAFKLSTENDYFGVHMDIRKKDGVVYLYPFPNGVAEQAGIRPGDELVAIDGMPVYGTSIYLAGARIRGELGTPIQLTTRSRGGIPRTHTLLRRPTHYRSVVAEEHDLAYLIKISRFSKDTGTHLGQLLASSYEQTKQLLIDLRGNQGGSLAAARQCAGYFLEEGSILYHLRNKSETVPVRAENEIKIDSPIVLLQDGSTASAAEAFISALVQNGRAISVGSKSFGKGLAQKFLPLSDGSALLLSFAEIITPCGMSIDDKGLEPTVRLPEELVGQDFSQEMMQAVLFGMIEGIHKEENGGGPVGNSARCHNVYE